MNGWVKLNRSLYDSEIWLYDKKFTYGQAWIDILLLAGYTDKRIRVRGIEINLNPGQMFWSMERLGERWGWSYRTVKKYLDFLKQRKMIDYKIENRLTVITILNWSKYQEKNVEKIIEKTEKSQDKLDLNFQGVKGCLDEKVQNRMQDRMQPNKNIKESKEINIINNNHNIYFDELTKQFQLSGILYNLIKGNDEKFKQPNLNSWSAEIDKLNRLDGRGWNEIEDIIYFCQNNDFWKGVILSPSSLRKNYTKLKIQMEKTDGKLKPKYDEKSLIRDFNRFGELQERGSLLSGGLLN